MKKDEVEFSVFPPRFKATGKFGILLGWALFALTLAAAAFSLSQSGLADLAETVATLCAQNATSGG